MIVPSVHRKDNMSRRGICREEPPTSYVGAGGGLQLLAFLLGMTRDGRGQRLASAVSGGWSMVSGLGAGALLPAALAIASCEGSCPVQIFDRLEALLLALLRGAQQLYMPLEGEADFLDRLGPWEEGKAVEDDELEALLALAFDDQLLAASPCPFAVLYYEASPVFRRSLALNDAAWARRQAVRDAMRRAGISEVDMPALLRMRPHARGAGPEDVVPVAALAAALRRPGVAPGADDIEASHDLAALAALAATASIFSTSVRLVSPKPWAGLGRLIGQEAPDGSATANGATRDVLDVLRRRSCAAAAAQGAARLTAVVGRATLRFFEPTASLIPASVRDVFFPLGAWRTAVALHFDPDAAEAVAAVGAKTAVELELGRDVGAPPGASGDLRAAAQTRPGPRPGLPSGRSGALGAFRPHPGHPGRPGGRLG